MDMMDVMDVADATDMMDMIDMMGAMDPIAVADACVEEALDSLQSARVLHKRNRIVELVTDPLEITHIKNISRYYFPCGVGGMEEQR